MDRYRNLLRRVAYLESLLFEGKQDQENLLNFLGQDYYDKYNLIKSKITDPEYKDIYRMMKKDLDEVEDYIDELSKKQSNMDLRREAKKGAKLIYNQNGWKVYRITTYEAAVYYGSNTKWCITGRYDDHESRGKEYFDNYIKDNDLDGGYYFYIKNDNEKYCLLRKKNGKIHSIWNASDRTIYPDDIKTIIPDFPNIPQIFDLDKPNSGEVTASLFSNNINDVIEAIDNGENLSEYSEEYDASPLTYHINLDHYDIVELLLFNGADPEYDEGFSVVQPIYMNNLRAMKMFFEAGIDPNGIEADGYTYFKDVLDLDDNYGMVRLFLKNGFSLTNRHFPNNYNAFQYAMSQWNAESVRALYDAGADLSDVINPDYNKKVKLETVINVLENANIDYSNYVNK